MCRGGSASKDLRAGDGKRTSGCVNVPASSQQPAPTAHCRPPSPSSERPPALERVRYWRLGPDPSPRRLRGGRRQFGFAQNFGGPQRNVNPVSERPGKGAQAPGFGVRSAARVKRARVGPEDCASDRGRPVTAEAGGERSRVRPDPDH